VIEELNARAGLPAAPGGFFLPLLPLGPDGVRRPPPRRTRPDVPLEHNRPLDGCQPSAAQRQEVRTFSMPAGSGLL